MTEVGLNQADRDALERCMELAQRDSERAEQLRSMLGDQPWEEVAEFAAHLCQYRALGLKPWQSPPSSVDEDDPDERDKRAQQLLRKMLAAGVSRYEPDPLKALQAKRRRLKPV
jgi:hypothetical protein